MKLPAEQTSEATARPEVRTGTGAGGSGRGDTGILAGRATVVRVALTGEAVITGAAVPGVGTVNRF